MPTAIRWPGVIKPGTVINDIGAHEDMLVTLVAAAGDPNVKEDLLKGRKVGEMTYKVHLDGYNLLPALEGQAEWPRHVGGRSYCRCPAGRVCRPHTETLHARPPIHRSICCYFAYGVDPLL